MSEPAEPRKISALTIITTLVMLALFVGLVWIVFQQRQSIPAADSEKREQRLKTLAELSAENQKILTTYHWVDKSKGIVGLPINRAMQVVLNDLAANHPHPAGPINPPVAGPSPSPAAGNQPSANPAPPASASPSPVSSPSAGAEPPSRPSPSASPVSPQTQALWRSARGARLGYRSGCFASPEACNENSPGLKSTSAGSITGRSGFPSQRDGTIVAWHEVPGNAAIGDPSRRVRREKLPLSHERRRPCVIEAIASTVADRAVPYGTDSWLHLSRHFVPGYDHAVPPGPCRVFNVLARSVSHPSLLPSHRFDYVCS